MWGALIDVTIVVKVQSLDQLFLTNRFLTEFIGRQRQVKKWRVDVVLGETAGFITSLRRTLCFSWLRKLFKRHLANPAVTYTASFTEQDRLIQGLGVCNTTWAYSSEGSSQLLHRDYNKLERTHAFFHFGPMPV